MPWTMGGVQVLGEGVAGEGLGLDGPPCVEVGREGVVDGDGPPAHLGLGGSERLVVGVLLGDADRPVDGVVVAPVEPEHLASAHAGLEDDHGPHRVGGVTLLPEARQEAGGLLRAQGRALLEGRLGELDCVARVPVDDLVQDGVLEDLAELDVRAVQLGFGHPLPPRLGVRPADVLGAQVVEADLPSMSAMWRT